MEKTMPYENGVYTGQVENDLPHGLGRLTVDKKDCYYDGQWVNGKRHGLGRYYRSYELDMDGAEVDYVNRVQGMWADDQCCGFIWEYLYESDPYKEKREETATFRDAQGLVLFGVDPRAGKLIGILAEPLQALELRYGKCFLTRNHRLCWGKVERDGHLFIGQLAETKEGAYYSDEYVPHGFCVEMEGEKILFCGMFDMGVRKGPGAEMRPFDPDYIGPFKMEYKVW